MVKLEIDRRLLPFVLALLAVAGLYANNSTTPTKPHTFTAGQTILSSQVNADFDTLYSELQGNVGTANLLDSSITSAKIVDATIVEADLASAVTLKLHVTGTVVDYIATTAPSGWVMLAGKTIGNASSGGTERANADTENLFTLLYNNMSDTQAPVSGGRGASAAADFAANKTITLPDGRGRVVIGDDNMGGSTASRVTAAGGNFDATVNGGSGGAQNHTLTTAQLSAHNHGVTDPGHVHSFSRVDTTQTVAVNPSGGSAAYLVSALATPNVDSNTTGISTQNAGSGNSHPILQPSLVLNKIIKLAAPMEVY